MFASIVRSYGAEYYYRFYEIVGPVLNEDIKNADGAYIGNPMMWSVGGLTHTENSAVTLNGVDQYCTAPATFDPTQDFSFVFVVKPDVVGGAVHVVATQTNGTGVGRSPLFIDSSGFYATNFGGSSLTTSFAPSGGYDFITGVYDASAQTYTLTVNGDAQPFSLSTEACNGTLLFGCGKLITNFFKGAIDEVAVFSRVLTTEETERMHEAFREEAKLYAIGGLDSKTISKYNEEYVLSEDKWYSVKAMPTPRFGAMHAMVGGRIYIIGGITANVVSKQMGTSSAVEVYDPLTNEFEQLSAMPVVDNGSVDGRQHSVAYGTAQHFRLSDKDYIYILGGMREIGQDGTIRSLNDRVLIYNVTDDVWTIVAAFSEEELDIYARVAPIAFKHDTKVYMTGGIVPDAAEESQGNAIRFLKDAVSFDVMTNSIELADNEFSTLPTPRYRSAVIQDDPWYFPVAGATERSNQTKLFEIVDSLQSPFGYAEDEKLPKSLADIGATLNSSVAAPYYNNKWAFLAGGFKSGRGDGFLQIRTKFSPTRVRLDGKQSCVLSICLVLDDGSPPPRPVKIRARGFLRFDPNQSISSDNAVSDQSERSQKSASRIVDDRIAIYPVLFVESEIDAVDGEARFTLLPRADDVLQGAQTIAKRLGLTTAELEDRFGIGKGQQLTNETLVIEAGRERLPYEVVVEITVVDSFYYGQTIEEVPNQGINDDGDIEDETTDEGEGETTDQPTEDSNNPCRGKDGGNEPEPESDPDEPIEPGTPVVGGTDEEFCKNGVSVPVTVSWQSFSQGVDTSGIPGLNSTAYTHPDASGGQTGVVGTGSAPDEPGLIEGAAPSFILRPVAFGQHSSPVIDYYSDIEWIPTIDVLVGNNVGTASEMLNRLENLANEIPFGASALFDAILAASRVMSANEVDELAKSIYLFTDNESNMSFALLDETINEVNAIDGEEKVPVVIGNFAVVKPVTLSARANSSDTDDLNRLSKETGGQSVSVLSADFEDEIVQIFVGEAIGAMGYGTYSFRLDLGSVVDIRRISALFNLFPNTNGNWTFSYSSNGFDFAAIDETYRANTDIAFSNLSARYLNFEVALLTGLTASNDAEYEVVPLPSSPTLTSIEVEYETRRVSFLFLKTEETDTVPQQVAVSVNANYVEQQDIEIGVAPSDSHNWLDYQSPSQRPVYSNGKVFVPIRSNDDFSSVPVEPLEKLDRHTFRAKFGRWDASSQVEVVDSKGTVVPVEQYRAFLARVWWCLTRTASASTVSASATMASSASG
ncbi:MAG: hypothetical protein HC888_01315 [Candidatus Competibacteraceae bacterium]|nr:hypothetical protein [Candidatus Competibacteraceae bacterium]